MSESQSSVLVHNRIEKNHRTTIILLALVPLVLLPYAAGIAVWWAPMVVLEAISYGPDAKLSSGSSCSRRGASCAWC
jgi:hypothetical protein